MQIGFYFYFKKIKVYGKEKLPKKGGVILSPNHQNGVIDPFIVGVDYGDEITSLTRADIFGGLLHKAFTAMKMIPVYRIRDGYNSLKNNDSIFDLCYSLLGKGKPVQIFSEGRQHENYYLMPISKGSSRMALTAQKMFPKQNIYIIPIGINYSNRRNPLAFIHLVYGDPIKIKEFIDKDLPEVKQINNIRDELTIRMKKCLWLPEKNEQNINQYSYINNLSGKESFEEIRNSLNMVSSYKESRELNKIEKIFSFAGYLLNLPFLLITNKVLSKIDDVVYYGTIKLVCGIFLLPLWWAILILITNFMNIQYSLIIVLASIITLYIRQINRNIIYNSKKL
ncbi:MAG: hypothetical protein CBC76_03180 [Flavobacteriaceae bacterium TMED116]|nr:MAG: hypothetical protein CBC76_03180 [Flavobacteriaceae bacterium TMED116]|tara:strand:- start:8416 stop:9429 length:1014 start_codon:yes stop_codon:yes gene_type:complete